MIPKHIWQTYESPYEDLSSRIKEYTNSWQEINPEYKYFYYDSKAREDFVLKEFGKSWLDTFTAMPLGVMRADVWRCMVLYIHGGVYADLDTMCNAPIESWIPEGVKFAIFPENFKEGTPNVGEHYATYMIAAEPKNEILLNIINLMFDRLQNPNYSYEHFVHELTGPALVTKVICDMSKSNKLEGFILLEHINTFENKSIKHVYASQVWKEDHISWIDERGKI